jgi:hypothetical protein
MDLGPQWPFWVRAGLALACVALLGWAAWRHAGAARSWLAGAPGLLLWWCAAVLPWWGEASFCRAAPAELPGCDWEYHRAPTEPRELVLFILLGGVFLAFRLGGSVAALVFTGRWALQRLRPVTRDRHPPTAR